MAKNKLIIISPLARLDLEEIWAYTYETWSIEQADKYQDELFNGFNEISENSKLGLSLNHIKKGYKQYTVNQHYIVFRVIRNNVDIIRVLHRKMDSPRHL